MAEETGPAVTTVQAWHAAVNAGDVEGALALCAPNVAVCGPRGTGIRLEPQHPLREVDRRVFVHEHAQWTNTQGAPAQARTDHPVDTWVVFTAADGLVTSVSRFETEDDALRSVAAVS